MGSNASKSFLTREQKDLTVIVSGQKFFVDKSVLALHSSVFSKMLDVGSKVNELVIDDIEVDTMTELVKYMYDRDTSGINKPDIIIKVVIAAKRYDIQELIGISMNKLKDVINNDNAIEIIKLAIQYKDSDIILYIIKTIVCKSLPIIKSDEMKEIYETHADIAPLFIQHLYDNQRRVSSPIEIPTRKCTV